MKIYQSKIVTTLVREVERKQIRCSADIFEYIKDAFDDDLLQECVFVVMMNIRGYPKSYLLHSKGSQTDCIFNVRDILSAVLIARCTTFAVVHNHPSGDPAPSRADTKVTGALREAADVVGLNFLDHIIVGDKDSLKDSEKFFSFVDAGLC